MAHPLLTTNRSRALAAMGIAGALALPAGPVLALSTTVDQVADEVIEICDGVLTADGVCEPVQETVETTTDAAGPVVEAADPVVGAADEVVPPPIIEPSEAVATVTDALPLGGDPSTGGGSGVPGSSGSGSTSEGSASSTSSEPGKVEAAGKGATEVSEPQAPPSADGRIAGGPTIQPLDAAALGSNMNGVRSQSGVTLQDYDAPLVSMPMDAPQVAGAPITTASPVAAMATEAVAFAGSAVLPHTTGAAAWVTATGLGLLAGTGVLWRRRLSTLDATTLDA